MEMSFLITLGYGELIMMFHQMDLSIMPKTMSKTEFKFGEQMLQHMELLLNIL